MIRRFVYFVLLLAILAAAPAFAAPLDLTPFARITASGTQNTFLLLWPRETDDAPYTVRDGDLASGWKTTWHGSQYIQLDFAPLNDRAPTIASVAAEWEREPDGKVGVRVLDYCGGNVLASQLWFDLTEPLVFLESARGYCLELFVREAGPANLLELHVYAESSTEVPHLENLAVEALPQGLRLLWDKADVWTHHVRIHYVASGEAASSENLIDIAPAAGSWTGPRPPDTGRFAIAVPVTEDGRKGPGLTVALPARDEPTLAGSGVVEGFYGRPWSHLERRRVINYLARVGLGMYIYGPKNDPLHRDEWRTPYDEEAIARFVELRRLGERVGVTMSFGISPGKDMAMDDPGERATLIAKLQPFVDGGYRHFTLLLDDIEGDLSRPINGDLGQEHVALANWLRGELSALAGETVTLWIVPTVYSSERQNRWAGGTVYLEEYAALAAEIEVMWTGTDTFSPTLGAADLEEVTELIGRAPAIWENEHATDGGDGFTGKVYASPYMNRTVDLVNAVVGIVANPMILGAANRLMLGTYAAYLQDPLTYVPDEAIVGSASLNGMSESDRALAISMTETFYGNGALGLSGVALPSNRPMEAAIDAFLEVVPDGSLGEIIAAGAALQREGARMLTMQNDLHHSGLDVSLVDDLWFPAMRMPQEGKAILLLLDWVGSLMAGQEDMTALTEADRLLFNSLLNRYQTSPFKVNSFRRRLAANPPGEMAFAAPLIAEPENLLWRVGYEWNFTPSATIEVAVYGLPGAEVVDGEIVWTPRHAGLYHAVVLAVDDAGWAWKPLTLTVRPNDAEPVDDDVPGDDDDDTAPDDDDDSAADDDDDDDDGCGC